ncbi:MAG: response regulator [Clostridia bacterium]|nr:response regulator [Clostridia bacterium]
MKLNIAICDDEQNQIKYVKDIVSEWSERKEHLSAFSEFPSSEAFLFDYAENRNYDILLLDIEMAKMNGIDLAKKVREGNNRVQIVFITGYPDFMSEGFEVAALHYLMKPVKKEKLFAVLDRAIENLGHKEESLVLETENGLSHKFFGNHVGRSQRTRYGFDAHKRK